VFRYGKVYGNYPDNCGGAIGVISFNKMVIDHCLFDQNEATDVSLYPNPGGGAIALDNSSPVIRNSRFTNNLSLVGGAIICNGGSNGPIYNNEFTGNTVITYGAWGQGYGGALCMYLYSDPAVSHNTFSSNHAGNSGGAIVCITGCNPRIDHNLVYNNTADTVGGGIEILDNCSPELINNTIANNESAFGGGVDVSNGSTPEIRNTIIWGNTAVTAGNQVNVYDTTCVPDFYYCDIQGGQAAFGGYPDTGVYENCMDMDPVFLDPVNDDYRLFKDNSPCINSGDPDASYNDPDGSRNDMGALWPPEWPDGINFEQRIGKILLSVYPNPVLSEAIVEYNIEQPADIRIMLVNQLGQEIMVMPIKRSPAGKQKISINVSTLPQGVYFIKLQKGNEIAAWKMIRL